MFTGICSDVGVVKRVQLRRGLLQLEIEAPRIARELRRGDSVSVNGVCLTATSTSRKRFSTEAMEETLARSTLGRLKKGSDVNLELPVRLVDRLGGHLVQGHVDGVAEVTRLEKSDGMKRVWLSASDDLLSYLVHKGSVALDGISLTVAEVGRTSFQVVLIPHTLEATTLQLLEVGSRTNVEIDVIAKYVERLTRRD
jgi:riboflavin synthase